jgi:GT2 family glycosyltransferase
MRTGDPTGADLNRRGLSSTGAPRRSHARRAVSVSVVICAYTTQRWQQMCAAVESVLAQHRPVDQILLVVDHNDALYERATSRYGTHPRVQVLPNTNARGLSGARNTGLGAATAQVIGFLDDDAFADKGWSQAMVGHYGDPHVAVVGGYAAPRWPVARPAWLPEEFDWVVGCSYRGQPTALASVRNTLGCNMSVRREFITAVEGFDSAVGRVGATPTGCDETELCIRIRQRTPTAQILFDPGMRVHHNVALERTTFRYFVRRCYHEGLSKAVMSRLVGVRDALSSERAYTRHVLPRAVARGLTSGRRDGVLKAAAVIAGLTVTAAGYAHGRLRGTLEGARR